MVQNNIHIFFIFFEALLQSLSSFRDFNFNFCFKGIPEIREYNNGHNDNSYNDDVVPSSYHDSSIHLFKVGVIIYRINLKYYETKKLEDKDT